MVQLSLHEGRGDVSLTLSICFVFEQRKAKARPADARIGAGTAADNAARANTVRSRCAITDITDITDIFVVPAILRPLAQCPLAPHIPVPSESSR